MGFDIALSGIQAINEQLDTISNNVANSGTYGFKSGRSNFAALYSGNQVNGTEVESTSQSMSLGGGILNTGDGLNASINGAGFFVSKDAQGQTTFSRVGIFTKDVNGQIVDANGNAVQGYGVVTNADGTVVPGALGALGNLTVPTGQIPAVASTTVDYVGNLSADWTVPVNSGAFSPSDPTSYNTLKVSTAYDSLGTSHTVTQYFTKTGTNAVQINYVVDGAPGAPAATANLLFNPDGSLDTADGPSSQDVIIPAAGANALTVNFDYTGTTQFAGAFTTATNQADGNPAGNFVSVALDNTGSLVATYSNGQSQSVGTLAIATFADQDALTAVSGTSWTANALSGSANLQAPGVGQAGAITTGQLEQSNVDITTELVNLMTAQRNYQANSKVITTESDTLQSLMQAIQ
jgi:flagellar hook protein FlgE